MPEAKDDLKREKVRVVPISNIQDFPDHPFQVKDDESMAQLVESIRMNGVLNPVIALKIDENHYQLISGHRRKHACILLGIDRIPLIGRELSKEEAVIEMVDSNLQREHILPSEKARAYKMKMEAMKQQGKRTDLTSSPLGTKLRTDEIIAENSTDSARQIQRYIRLTNLIPELLDLVDEERIAFTPAVELSYLNEVEQADLVEEIRVCDATPNLSQAQRLRAISKEEGLTPEHIGEILAEEKANQKPTVKFSVERLQKVAPKVKESDLENFVMKACEHYYRYLQRQRNRDAR